MAAIIRVHPVVPEIQGAIYSSPLAKKRKRVAHLDNAAYHLGEQHARLLHRHERFFQKDITTEPQSLNVKTPAAVRPGFA